MHHHSWHEALGNSDFRASVLTILIVVAVMVGIAFFWAKHYWPKIARPSGILGALIGLACSSIATAALGYAILHALWFGYVNCSSSRRHRCGQTFMDAASDWHFSYQHDISLIKGSAHFWFIVGKYCVIETVALSWLIVCLLAFAKKNRDEAKRAELEHYRRP